MGNAQNGLNRYLKIYSENEALIDPAQTSNVKIYYSPNAPDFIMMLKTIDFVNLGLKADILPQIQKRAENLPLDCLPGEPEFNNKIMGSIDVKFLNGSMNLNDFVLIRRYQGQSHMAEPDVTYLLEYLIDIGCQLQKVAEYHYLLNMSNVFVTTQGLKIQNPFIYKSYISESQKLVDHYDWLNSPGHRDEQKARYHLDSKLYCDKIKQNVRQVGLIVLFSGLHRHDTNLTDEQNLLDKDLITSALSDFKALFSKQISTRVEALIRLDSEISNLALFTEARVTAPGANSTFKVGSLVCQKNFASKIHSQGGYFFRNYDLPPKEHELNLAAFHQQVKPQNQSAIISDYSAVEMSMRAERPNFNRRSVSPPIHKEELNKPQPQPQNPQNQLQPPSHNPTAQNQPLVNPNAQRPSQPQAQTGSNLQPSQGSLFNPQVPQNPPKPTNQQSLSNYPAQFIPMFDPRNPTTPQKPSANSAQSPPQPQTEHIEVDPLDALHIKEHDAIYGKIEQVFRERRPQASETVNKSQLKDQSLKPHQSMVDTSNLHNHHYTGRFEKDPSTFKFPIMNTGSKEQPRPNPSPFVDPLGPNIDNRNPSNATGQLPDTHPGPQTIYTMGRSGPRAIGPSAFIPPLDRLGRFKNSRFNPFEGSKLYNIDERNQYISQVNPASIAVQPNFQVNPQPMIPSHLQPGQPSQIPLPFPASPSQQPFGINFFTPQNAQAPFAYSPNTDSRKPFSPPALPINLNTNQQANFQTPASPWQTPGLQPQILLPVPAQQSTNLQIPPNAGATTINQNYNNPSTSIGQNPSYDKPHGRRPAVGIDEQYNGSLILKVEFANKVPYENQTQDPWPPKAPGQNVQGVGNQFNQTIGYQNNGNAFNNLGNPLIGATPHLDEMFNRPNYNWDQRPQIPPSVPVVIPLPESPKPVDPPKPRDERGHHFLAYMEKVRKLALDAGVGQRTSGYFNPMRR